MKKLYVCLVVASQWSGLGTQAAPLIPLKEESNRPVHAASSGSMLPPVSFVSAIETRAAPPQGIVAANSNTSYSEAGLQCGVTSQVGAETDKYERCPDTCPFFAQNREDTKHCTFLCVPGEKCQEWNPKKPIADTIKRSRTCRGPKVKFCSEPELDGTDSCRRCQRGFQVHFGDGQCYFQYWLTFVVFGLVIVVLMTVVTTWIVDWCSRATINQEGVNKGISHRARSKILMPRSIQPDGARHVWDLDTNMCKINPVPGKKGVPAGPGMLLHFNFQAFFIVWPLIVAIIWTIIACFHNELFILGTRKFGTPRHNCILVAWGYETQHRLMWTKNLFLAIVYVFSFVTFLLFSIRQLRIYQSLDKQEKSMKDFAVELTGLPQLPGDYELSAGGAEVKIKELVGKATGMKVVGVSVAWNFGECEENIMEAVTKDITKREESLGLYYPVDVGDPTATMPAAKRRVYAFEKSLLGYSEEEGQETAPEEEEETLEKLLLELRSSDTAFVVFDTEEAKDAAVEWSKVGHILNLQFEGKEYPLTLNELECEPGTVNWQNFGDSGAHVMLYNGAKAIMQYYVPALAIWFFLFYVPYAASLYNFNYDNGAELPGFYAIVFTMVVVGGNATMYVICDIIGDKIGFKYKDSKQTAYMILYLIACMINVLLDMVVTYMTALKVMRGLDFRNYFGVRLDNIHSFTEQFETYAMQRSLGENTYAYAFPSTFLVPFILEPIVTILVPYQLGKLIVRTHKEV
jgi:hypothetical protein